MTDKQDNPDERITTAAKQAFDESVDSLDAATLSRLNRGRQTALAELARPNRGWQQWMPASGLAAAVLLAVFAFRGPAEVDFSGEPVTDLEILLSEESIEMFEDLEFYSWLATQELEGNGDLG
ncbi:MAG TPA: hypothetical protein PKH39_03060 [Woeseiaceae bacterium]|nr:hypothetical protein [Woeseiaceae bacterium]